MNEAELYKDNCFVTLTYNEESLPDNGSVKKEDLQWFMKRLRKKIDPLRVRFYGCGEYGDEKKRPHYHILLFGYDFPDKEIVKIKTKKNRFNYKDTYKVYRSCILEKVWDKGFSDIGSVTMESAGYVARYIRKKITGPLAKAHYKGLEPEFALMSRRPGIGSEWIKRFMYDVYPKDYTHIKGKKVSSCRFYDNRLMVHDWDMYQKVKEKRRENHKRENIIRRKEIEKYNMEITKNLRRGYEDGENS